MKMTQPKQPTQTPDDLLADFTDRMLDGKTAVLASPADDELRGLEETVMRLKRVFPQEAPDEATLKRLQADFRSRARSANKSSQPVWQSQQSRRRLILAFTAIVILATIFIGIPFLLSGGGNVQGTAGLQSQSILTLVAVGCIIVLLIWLGRRK